eukprot:CAMPEP_0177555896 /NCGR_PEP_ID=MMETSP0369-20130122/68797_1 /TAXON_ID=447022 ORGANISM="Scrippsiella hangoei-like, Strain SHHI-4" /NCGR_SAMPLE_ID=MMETSP0369 /ASSEMBLY_ACC=CAM_ASM_000364 /LENGTH=127 /DNA_ID=CAMNT_0019042089 /DNA_START=51 /DNA_END=434 /DNA_ORIENTATION=-
MTSKPNPSRLDWWLRMISPKPFFAQKVFVTSQPNRTLVEARGDSCTPMAPPPLPDTAVHAEDALRNQACERQLVECFFKEVIRLEPELIAQTSQAFAFEAVPLVHASFLMVASHEPDLVREGNLEGK